MSNLTDLNADTIVINKESGWISTAETLVNRIKENSEDHMYGKWHVAIKPSSLESEEWGIGEEILINVIPLQEKPAAIRLG